MTFFYLLSTVLARMGTGNTPYCCRDPFRLGSGPGVNNYNTDGKSLANARCYVDGTPWWQANNAAYYPQTVPQIQDIAVAFSKTTGNAATMANLGRRVQISACCHSSGDTRPHITASSCWHTWNPALRWWMLKTDSRHLTCTNADLLSRNGGRRRDGSPDDDDDEGAHIATAAETIHYDVVSDELIAWAEQFKITTPPSDAGDETTSETDELVAPAGRRRRRGGRRRGFISMPKLPSIPLPKLPSLPSPPSIPVPIPVPPFPLPEIPGLPLPKLPLPLPEVPVLETIVEGVTFVAEAAAGSAAAEAGVGLVAAAVACPLCAVVVGMAAIAATTVVYKVLNDEECFCEEKFANNCCCHVCNHVTRTCADPYWREQHGCLHGDTTVWTREGPVAVKSLKLNTEIAVLGWDGQQEWAKAAFWISSEDHSSEQREYVKICTGEEDCFTVTDGHRIKVLTADGSILLQEAKSLKIGDMVFAAGGALKIAALTALTLPLSTYMPVTLESPNVLVGPDKVAASVFGYFDAALTVDMEVMMYKKWSNLVKNEIMIATEGCLEDFECIAPLQETHGKEGGSILIEMLKKYLADVNTNDMALLNGNDSEVLLEMMSKVLPHDQVDVDGMIQSLTAAIMEQGQQADENGEDSVEDGDDSQ